MIPYFEFISFNIGPLTIYIWGVFVVLGILIGLFLLAQNNFFSSLNGKDWGLNLILYLIIAAIVGGRLGYILFYNFSDFLERPLSIFKIWEGGMSSLGGFLATTLVLFFFLPVGKKLKYLDILTIPFVIAWGVGRIGCFMIHDHVGKLSDFFLAVQFPGGARHDLALYEILILALFLIIYLLSTRSTKLRIDGSLAGIFIVYYSFVRFFLDFLRASDLPNADVRYFYLTPAQYGMVLFFILGIYLLTRSKRNSILF